jgi:NhaA family Na+:H+ antiporter
MKNPKKRNNPFSEFLQLEASAGIFLFCSMLLALIIANSPLYKSYHDFFAIPFSIHIGTFKIEKSFLYWINDGFMSIFFLLLGLEIKREMLVGELKSFSKALLPVIAAIGGMLLPALIYTLFNYGDNVAMRGWAIPCATDTAFSIGVLALLGSRIPTSLKIFLTAVAIFDDIGAIMVIAIFYTQHISIVFLLMAVIFLGVLFLLNYLKITRFAPYLLVGVLLWVCVLKSGVHATLAGFAIALAIPLKDSRNNLGSPLRNLEHMLHPWVAYGILPLFAFANAGVSFASLSLKDFYANVPLGIACGLFFGKPIGICGASLLAITLGIAKMPRAASRLGIFGVAIVAGIGFTMSLFIGDLAFEGLNPLYMIQVKLGVIIGSLVAGTMGYWVLRKFHSN